MVDEAMRAALNDAVIPKFSQRDKDEADAAAFKLQEESPFAHPKQSDLQTAIQNGAIPIIRGENTEIGFRLGRGHTGDAYRDYEHQHGPIRHGKTAGVYIDWKF
jgi:hypothetical protein